METMCDRTLQPTHQLTLMLNCDQPQDQILYSGSAWRLTVVSSSKRIWGLEWMKFWLQKFIFPQFLWVSQKHYARYFSAGERRFNTAKYKPLKQNGKAKWGHSLRVRVPDAANTTSGGGEGGHTGCVKKENKIKKVIEKLKGKCEGNYAVMLQSVKPWEEPSCIM